MKQKMQIKRGLKSALPDLDVGELALTTDNEDIYVGTPMGNRLVGGKSIDTQLAETAVKLTGFISVKEYGAKGDGIKDDTEAFINAINDCKLGGKFQGNALSVPTGNYRITRKLVIDAPVNIFGMASGVNSNLHNSPKLIFDNCSGFEFTRNSGYCHFKDLRLVGQKTGIVDVDANIFGNCALLFGYGSAGMYENMRVEDFDTGHVSYTREGDTWSGAYRYFNYVKFLRNTYNMVQMDVTTDSNFFQCDFRDRLAVGEKREGYVYINCTVPGDYQTTNFIGCMFELIGDARENPRKYNEFGIQIKGKSIVKIIGGYSESCPTFVDKGASLITSANIVGSSNSLIHAGGGLINMGGAYGRGEKLNLPPISDTTVWSYSGCTYDSKADVNGIRGYKFTVTNASAPQVTTSNFDFRFLLSLNSIPFDAQRILVKFEIEYACPIGRTVSLQLSGHTTEGNWNDKKYYDTIDGWRRKTYTVPIPITNTGYKVELIPRILFEDSQVGDVFYIRTTNITIYSE